MCSNKSLSKRCLGLSLSVWLSLSLWLGLCLTGLAVAADSAPIAVYNSLPIMQGSGLTVPQSANVSKQKGLSWLVNASLQSHANDAGVRASSQSFERLVIDAEVLRLDARLQWQLAPRWQASIKLGSLRNSAGGLDSLIGRWHSAFDLTQGDRGNFAEDQFLISYANQAGQNRLNRATSGITDTEISVAYQLVGSANYSLAAHAYANLPTGKSAKLTGSDSTDLGFSVALASVSSGQWAWHTNLGVVMPGDTQLFGLETVDTIWQGSAGVHWQPRQRWRWTAQIDAHDGVFNSQIEELNRSAWQLSLGLEFAQQWQIYLAEDLSVNRAADFSFGLNWRSDF